MLAVVLLLSAAYGLLYTPAVQTFMLERITNHVSRELGTEVSVARLEFKPFRSIVLFDVDIQDREGNDLFSVSRFDLRIRKLSFRHKYLAISEILLHEAVLDVRREKGEEDYNFGFLINYLTNGEKQNQDRERWRITCSSLRLENTVFQMNDPNRVLNPNGFNHSDFSLTDMNLAARDIHILNNQLIFELDYFRYKESRGFKLNHLSGSFSLGNREAHITDFLFQTPSSDVRFDFSANYSDFFNGRFVWDDLAFNMDLQPSKLCLADIGHFYSEIYGVCDTFAVSGVIQGDGIDLKANSLNVSGGTHTQFNGDVFISGIDQVNSADYEINIIELKSSVEDIAQFRLPYAWQHQSINVPDYLYTLGDAGFSGRLTGNFREFNALGVLTTEIGKLNGNVHFFQGQSDSVYQYQGGLQAESFDLGLLFDDEMLGQVDMSTNIRGQGFTVDDLDIEITGNIYAVEFLGHRYQNLELEGSFVQQKFSGAFLVDDPDIFLDFRGTIDFNNPVPVFDFQTYIDHANLSRLNVFQRDSQQESLLSADVLINAKASSMYDLEGVIMINDLVYEEYPIQRDRQAQKSFRYETESIVLSNTLWPDSVKHLRIRSDILDADAYGQFQFAGIGSTLRELIHQYLPALEINNNNRNGKADLVQDINFDLLVKDTETLTELFMPIVSLSSGTWLNGNFRSGTMDFELEAAGDTLTFSGRDFINWRLDGRGENGRFKINSYSDLVMLSDSIFMNHVDIHADLSENMIDMVAVWNPDDQYNSGRIQMETEIIGPNRYQLSFLPSYAYFEGDHWQLNVDNMIILEKERIEVMRLRAYHKDQFFYANGVLSTDPRDRMMLSFADFDVSYSALFMRTQNFEFAGKMDGYVNFTGLFQTPSVAAELFVSDFSFNHVVLGDLEVVSEWDDVHEAFKVDASIIKFDTTGVNQPLTVSGYIRPADENQNFDLALELNNKPMSVWGRYMKNFAEDFRGYATGSLRMDGLFDSPELSGRAHVERAGIHIPYLNVTYYFDDDVEVGKSFFRFNNLVLRDSLNNNATLTGDIMHQVFKDFSLDLRMNPDRMLIFNTGSKPQDFYYGTAFLTGMAHIHGPANDITMDVSARTNRGTSVNLPLSYSGEIRESHFISFVSREKIEEGPAFYLPELPGQLTLNFDLEVTPDADVYMFFDTRFGDIIRGRGAGNLRMEVSPEGAFNIYGDYVIEDGEYIFSLQNIINKRFRIDQGSTVRWTGDLNDADVDLRAAYRLRTPLYDLLAGEAVDDATSEVYRRRIPVETILILEDKLFNPVISFEIQVPGGDENTRELIERVITTEQEMNRQVFSLLVLNRFMPTTTDQYNTALGYGVGSTSSELLSNQLSNWLSQISSDFDIGVNYRPGDELSSQELELALSTQLFDDRVMIDGNFGVAGNQNATGHTTQSTSQIIGDVNVEVKITPDGKLRVKAFNRSNTFDIINTNSPYTQGVGLFYRREFDTLTDLFRRSLQQEPEIVD